MDQTMELREGERMDSTDFYFYQIGEPLAVESRRGGYDRDHLPSQGLALSKRRELIFVTHPSGFYVALVYRLLVACIYSGRHGPSVQDMSLLNVDVGPVRLLLLSPDSCKDETLAAVVGGTVNFFSVDDFFVKLQRLSFSCSIDEGSSVKDMNWLKKTENSFILLTSHGKLYCGSIYAPLQFLMDNVDAVDCSAEDDIAVARNNILSILSSKSNEERRIALSLQPWTGEPDDFSVKVDSLKWVRPDCIVLGCIQRTSDGTEESYLLQVIRPTGSEIFHSFRDVFLGIDEGIIPARSGPYLFFSCLEQENFAIAANRKSVDHYVVVFDWSLREPMVLVDIDREDALPRIELQENGDDNSILGLCIDEYYGDYTLWCLTLEGKLIGFEFFQCA